MVLGGHLLLMVQCTHLLLVMLNGHLLLMMLSIYLLLMIHHLLPMSRSFVLDSFVVGPRLVSLNVVIVAVNILSCVCVPLVVGRVLVPVFLAVQSCSLCMLFTGDVFSFSRSGCTCAPNVLSAFALVMRLIK
jgi:hypothetical protein